MSIRRLRRSGRKRESHCGSLPVVNEDYGQTRRHKNSAIKQLKIHFECRAVKVKGRRLSIPTNRKSRVENWREKDHGEFFRVINSPCIWISMLGKLVDVNAEEAFWRKSSNDNIDRAFFSQAFLVAVLESNSLHSGNASQEHLRTSMIEVLIGGASEGSGT